MLKKILFSGVILTISSSVALAGTPYVGLGVGSGSKSGVNFFGGYGKTLGSTQRYYLGGELSLLNLSYSQFNHMNYGIGASFLPGIYVNENTLLYTRLGLETYRNGFSHHSSTGAQVGLGLQTSLFKNLDLRGEYVHTSNINTKQFNIGLVYKFG